MGGQINFVLGANIRTTPPTNGVQNGCNGNAVCLATGSRTRHFMIAYFKNAKAYKFQNMHIFLIN